MYGNVKRIENMYGNVKRIENIDSLWQAWFYGLHWKQKLISFDIA